MPRTHMENNRRPGCCSRNLYSFISGPLLLVHWSIFLFLLFSRIIRWGTVPVTLSIITELLFFPLQETITNAETAKEWFLAAAKEVMHYFLKLSDATVLWIRIQEHGQALYRALHRMINLILLIIRKHTWPSTLPRSSSLVQIQSLPTNL